ncbi:hypothetical protein AK812_SmicGene14278 [Symbiodinium microadriaticum]|uniref:Uncharacterized protein n=1 Tax=Symbiodinium microadriaticum TaxID=2951 RepID=A0A1Q9E5X5_SYMMI|nr:hypothetical protein AK812_SmicGene14278 [Symbiodinium microadriaticum]
MIIIAIILAITIDTYSSIVPGFEAIRTVMEMINNIRAAMTETPSMLQAQVESRRQDDADEKPRFDWKWWSS